MGCIPDTQFRQVYATIHDFTDVDLPETITQLNLSIDSYNDWLVALEVGSVLDGQPQDHFIEIDQAFSFIRRGPEEEVIGFSLGGLSDFDPEHAALWESPFFDAPVLGLDCVPAGAIVVAARRVFPGVSTGDVVLFQAAVGAEGDEAALEWRLCLGAGNLKAHFGLGYTLCELDRHREAYPHLHRYAELVPHNAWAWCWLGKACQELDQLTEARTAFEQAILLEEEGSFETDAAELLAQTMNQLRSTEKRRHNGDQDEAASETPPDR